MIPPHSSAIGDASHAVRNVFHEYCEKRISWPKLECHEVEPWDEARTLDTIHPTDDLHYDIAQWFRDEIL